MKAVIPALLATGGAATGQAYNLREVLRRKPGARPTGAAIEALGDALDKRVDEIKPGARVKQIGLEQNVPKNLREDILNTTPYASNARGDVQGTYNVRINPNADRAYFAHELGHIASDQTDIGRMVRSLRDNPALSRSLLAAALIGGGATAALTPGDDDLETGLALSYAAAIPTLIDEGLATRNGLAIMDHAGMRATMGQRGRLAGGYLSYVAAPLVGAMAANAAGNLIDEDQQTISTIEP